MKASLWLAGYLAAVVAASFIHAPLWLAAALLAAVLFSGRHRLRLLLRTVIAIAVFNATVSVGYTMVATWRGEFVAEYLLLVNLRVLLMVYLGMWFITRVSLLEALSFAPTLRFLATVAASQVVTLRRVLLDYRQAFRSRTLGRAGVRQRMGHASAQGTHLLDKAVHDAAEATQALRSRGYFDA
jgi:cobalt/nickel transport system permease protein